MAGGGGGKIAEAVGEVNEEIAGIGVADVVSGEKGAEIGAAAAAGFGRRAVAVEAERSVEFGVGVVEIDIEMGVAVEEGAEFGEKAGEEVGVDGAAGVDADVDAEALAFEDFEVEAAADEPPVETAVVGGVAHKVAPEEVTPGQGDRVGLTNAANPSGGRTSELLTHANGGGDDFAPVVFDALARFVAQIGGRGEKVAPISVAGKIRHLEIEDELHRQRARIALHEDGVDLFDTEAFEFGFPQSVVRRTPPGLGKHAVDDNVGGKIEDLGIASAGAEGMPEGDVQDLVGKDKLEIVLPQRLREGGVEEDGDAVGGGGGDGGVPPQGRGKSEGGEKG